jgi:kynurenine formamidase
MIIPLHGALMRDMGVVLSEIWWLDDLAADSAEDGQYTFMLVAAPLKMEEGTGSPVNPVAIK